MKGFSEFLSERVEIHSELNPRIWDGETPKSDVREKLLSIAKAWAEYAHIKWKSVKDVYLCGGNANYNYTDHSDIDVHLVVNRSSLGDPEIIDDFLKGKKELWALQHHNEVVGYPVELYAQDPSEKSPAGQGVWSLKRDVWVVRPDRRDESSVPIAQANRKATDLKKRIDRAIHLDHAPAIRRLKHKIASMRKAGLAATGEFSPENLAFKILRDDGYLQKITDYVGKYDDDKLSLRRA